MPSMEFDLLPRLLMGKGVVIKSFSARTGILRSQKTNRVHV